MMDPLTPWLLRPLELGSIGAKSSTWLSSRLSIAPADLRGHVESQGLKLVDDVLPHVVLFDVVTAIIGLVPNLETVIADLVTDIYLLRAEPGYDVSHSEPQWRSRIFVSVPEQSDRVGAMRLAESVIHEAMHLNLTLLELSIPLVRDENRAMKSPWRIEPRSHRGVAHGLFVFTCLRTYFGQLISTETGAALAHIRARIDDIKQDISSIDVDELANGLTPLGSSLVRTWSRLATEDIKHPLCSVRG
jgi:hypothetical protein